MVFLDQHRVEVGYNNVDEPERVARMEMVKEAKELNKRCTLFTPLVGEQVNDRFKEAEVSETLQIWRASKAGCQVCHNRRLDEEPRWEHNPRVKGQR